MVLGKPWQMLQDEGQLIWLAAMWEAKQFQFSEAFWLLEGWTDESGTIIFGLKIVVLW